MSSRKGPVTTGPRSRRDPKNALGQGGIKGQGPIYFWKQWGPGKTRVAEKHRRRITNWAHLPWGEKKRGGQGELLNLRERLDGPLRVARETGGLRSAASQQESHVGGRCSNWENHALGKRRMYGLIGRCKKTSEERGSYAKKKRM